ncbi:MAG TPA: hypothetical protein VKE51_00835 [Vicinamibacterales bacterium]|nr:hypothetical protein [Vicinamibacterales bacterium]
MGLTALFYPWGLLLQALAIVHFVRRRPETYWLWIILIGGGLGALVYIVAEVLPDVNLVVGSLEHFSRRRRIRLLEQVILDNPAIGNQEELADLYLEEGRFARARELYDMVIAASRSESLDPFYRRGVAELGLQDYGSARADLEHVVAKDPKYDFHRAIGLLAHAHGCGGDPEQADALFKRATDISTLSETYYNYAAFLDAQKRPAEAKAWAERILAKKPTMPRYLRRRERPWFRKASALLKRL